MSKRKPTKPRRAQVAEAYAQFVRAIGLLIELRDLPGLTADERKLLDCAYQFAGDARDRFDDRTGARLAWDEQWRDMMRTNVVVLDDRERRPILEPEAAK